ncbi:MAG: hypothetical protein DRQ24_11910 [Candidatus Latescibacterota bacterium]|nr:MAG: hypothetical protein DRQ24_11910 [Candidatus Latescibacterota bacterium]
MGRIRISVYGNGRSKSARKLARELGIKRLKVTGSRFRAKNMDTILNWGLPKTLLPNVVYLNPIESVRLASNKLHTLNTLYANNISVPTFVTDSQSLVPGCLYMARTILQGHSGIGVVVGEAEGLPSDAPLYTKAIDKVAEYRVIVVNGKAVDIKAKKKKNDWTENRDKNVWNHSNGYVFARNVGTFPCNLKQLGVDSVEALGLRYGAVDIIEDGEGVLYTLEVNTAFGLDGTTITLVADEFRRMLYGRE